MIVMIIFEFSEILIGVGTIGIRANFFECYFNTKDISVNLSVFSFKYCWRRNVILSLCVKYDWVIKKKCLVFFASPGITILFFMILEIYS